MYKNTFPAMPLICILFIQDVANFLMPDVKMGLVGKALVALFFLFLAGYSLAEQIDCGSCTRLVGAGNNCSSLNPVGTLGEQAAFCKKYCEYDYAGQKNFQCALNGSAPKCVKGTECTGGTCCWIEAVDANLTFSKQYVEDTIRNRGFNPLAWGMTPFDDIVFDFKLLACGGQGCVDKAKAMEKTGAVSIVAGSPSSPRYEKFLDLDSGSAKLLGTKPATEHGPDCKYLFYRWEDELRGWENGALPSFAQDGNMLNILIDKKAIRGDLNVNGRAYYSPVRRTGNCVYLNGSDGSDGNASAKRKFVYAQDDSFEKGAAEFVLLAQDYIGFGFGATEPFKYNLGKLAHFVELKKGMLPWGRGRGSDCVDKVAGAITIEVSPAFVRSVNPKAGGFTSRVLNGKIFLSSGPSLPYTEIELAGVMVHEVGHALCGLNDESKKARLRVPGALPFEKLFLGTNCRDFNEDFGIYGNNLIGCAEEKALMPSFFSLMNYYPMDAGELNVVSCGFCLNSINRSHSSSAFDTCLGMPGVIKPGVECTQDIHCTGVFERPYCSFCSATNTCEHREPVPCASNFENQGFFGRCDSGRCTPNESVQCVNTLDCKLNEAYDAGCIDACNDGTCVFSPEGTECYKESGGSPVKGACSGGVCQLW